jgi:hypothetical protein
MERQEQLYQAASATSSHLEVLDVLQSFIKNAIYVELTRQDACGWNTKDFLMRLPLVTTLETTLPYITYRNNFFFLEMKISKCSSKRPISFHQFFWTMKLFTRWKLFRFMIKSGFMNS